MNKTILATTIAALLTAGYSTNLFADSNGAATTAAQQNAAISMEQAVAIAEQATGGKNSDSEFELEDGVSLYEVSITMADGAEVEVNVDAQSGAVLSQEAEEDEDDDEDEDEDENEEEDDDENEDEDDDKDD